MGLLNEGALMMLGQEGTNHLPGFARTLMNSNLCALGVMVARGALTRPWLIGPPRFPWQGWVALQTPRYCRLHSGGSHLPGRGVHGPLAV